MKKQLIAITVTAFSLLGMCEKTHAGETSLAAYATYWDGEENGNHDGSGGGLKLRQKILGFLAADVRTGYLDFSDQDQDTSVIPLEVTLMVGIPLMLEPYAGVGASYYLVDSDLPETKDGNGFFGLLGLQFNLFVVGAVAEVRYTDADIDLMDGVSGNLGLMIKW